MTTCNMCGESCELSEGMWKEDAGLIDCVVSGGYVSTPGNGYGALDDCTRYRFSICEFCLDYLFSKFAVPPMVFDDGSVEYVEYVSAPERVKMDGWRKMKEQFFKEYERRNVLRQERMKQ